jgi:hypothetical protein
MGMCWDTTNRESTIIPQKHRFQELLLSTTMSDLNKPCIGSKNNARMDTGCSHRQHW